MKGQFRYKGRDVFPDLRRYIDSLDPVYCTTTSSDIPHMVDELTRNVSRAISDTIYREVLLEEPLPDRVRILLDGVDLLSWEEIQRRWDMLASMYREFADTESKKSPPKIDPKIAAAVGDGVY